MNRTYFYALILLAGVYACNNEAPVNEEPVEETASSEDLMNAYVDSLNMSTDGLKEIYRNMLNGAANNLDSTKQLMAAKSLEVSQLKENLNRLSLEVNSLVEQKKITDADYQAMFHEINFNDVQTSEDALNMLGLSFTGEIKTEVDSIDATD